MSQENVEIVGRYLEEMPEATLELGQFPAWVAGFWESDGDDHPVHGFPEARPCHGREEIVNFLAEVRAAWEVWTYVVKDARAIGDNPQQVAEA